MGKWYYKDQDDLSQGPFHANDMRAWMDAGYISGDLNARLVHVGPYINLMELYADLSSAFTTIPDVTVVAVAIQPKKQIPEEDPTTEKPDLLPNLKTSPP